MRPVSPRAAFRRHRGRRPAARRQPRAGAGLVVSLAVIVGLTGAGAAPSASTGLTDTAAVGTSWRAGPALDTAAAATADAVLGDAIMRDTPERAARSAERARSATLAAETTRRAATEAALAATEQVKDIARVPPPAPAWQAPLDGGYNLTSGFGPRWGKLHPAQDFATPVGNPVRSPSNGTVVFAGWDGSYGHKLEIQLWDGTVVWFAHNSALGVTQGQAVVTGQVVAASGNTGHSTGPHVHMEVRPGGGDPVPVMEWLAARGIPM